MQCICPLENNSFTKEIRNNKEIVKHLKKCPLFLKSLYYHYSPFYFPHINDSIYALTKKINENEGKKIILYTEIENILDEYYKLFNDTILDILIKKDININTYELFIKLKYKILLKWFLKYGNKGLFVKLEDSESLKKIKKKLNQENLNNSYNLSLEYIEKFVNNYIENVNNQIVKTRGPSLSHNDDEVDKTKIYLQPILSLKSIENIHNYKICKSIVHFIDMTIFCSDTKEDEFSIDNAENNNRVYNKDEIFSLIIYLTIYLCCKTSIQKRVKNNILFGSQKEDSSLHKSIHYLLKNINKHDIQNINMVFIFLYFNKSFYNHFESLINKKDIFYNQENIQTNLFIELGAGKGNTTRWVHFIMNNLVDILELYFKKDCQRFRGSTAKMENETSQATNDKANCEGNGKTHSQDPKRSRCKILIIEREAYRNKKEKKGIFMEMENNIQNILRVKSDVGDFNLFQLLNFLKNKNQKQENRYIVPDIIQYYYYNGIYKKNSNIGFVENDQTKIGDIKNVEKTGSATKTDLIPSDNILIKNLHFIEQYFDVHVQKLYSFLSQGNNNIFRVYDNMEFFLKNFECQKVSFLTKHLCGNGTDLALRMLINNIKSDSTENYFIISTCCHHRCDVDQILGIQYLMDLKMDIKYFQHIIHHISGYASCANKEKRQVGKKIKLLIDLVRIRYLIGQGMKNAYLVKYVNQSITIEKHAILFFNNNPLDLREFKSY
ncbi:methyltransferase, putative [Plasmodium vinckei vinckei]|uniref:tRNA:m(4)X modification enzyme TRM13 n=1 Tax=Plasmodium vinckei vinckei TaxID=54757 RepID=A0A449BSW1_PLAVN|nr:methyltransferase, putative [Plasmodium vinckei vinckei]KEG02242.1 hypothetical protein YYE_02981 [Plasmodium vinckei vinckei]VEV56483.1 methyltransferase, putative [Plasmodium vinckei vinckei]